MLFDKIINTAYSFGAAIVIFGAWGKIEHKEFGSTALTAGLLTETAIFCIYGMLEWRKSRIRWLRRSVLRMSLQMRSGRQCRS